MEYKNPLKKEKKRLCVIVLISTLDLNVFWFTPIHAKSRGKSLSPKKKKKKDVIQTSGKNTRSIIFYQKLTLNPRSSKRGWVKKGVCFSSSGALRDPSATFLNTAAPGPLPVSSVAGSHIPSQTFTHPRWRLSVTRSSCEAERSFCSQVCRSCIEVNGRRFRGGLETVAQKREQGRRWLNGWGWKRLVYSCSAHEIRWRMWEKSGHVLTNPHKNYSLIHNLALWKFSVTSNKCSYV